MAPELFRFYHHPIDPSHRRFKRIKRFLKDHAIKHRIIRRGNWVAGAAWPDRNEIAVWIDDDMSVQDFLSVALHEISHVLAYREGCFKTYHTSDSRMTVRKLEILIRTGLRAERFVDRRAEKLMKQLFPDIPFNGYYHRRASRRWFHENLVAPWKKELAKRRARLAARAP